MADITIRRHQSIFDPAQYPESINIIGCGATGSRVFMALVELGCMNINCYDFDHVEDHNLANQAFLASHILVPKVDACRNMYRLKTGRSAPETMTFNNARVPVKDAGIMSGIVFLLTDTMASRREIYEEVIKDNPLIPFVIETRMASTHGNVNVFDPNDPKQAKKWVDSLIDDGEAELSPCGQPISVGTTASIIANLAVMQYMWWSSNPEAANQNIEIYLKPFMTSGA
jgi:molybdopterin/thiamine biosynthesis adenylyltransferase